MLERLSPQTRRIELTTPLDVSADVSRDASCTECFFVKPTVAPSSLLSPRHIERVGRQPMKMTDADREVAPVLLALSDLRPSTTDSFSVTSQLRRSSILLFMGGTASLCFHYFVFYQFSAWTPLAELASPSVINATVVTRAGVPTAPSLSRDSKHVASLPQSLSPSRIEKIRAHPVNKIEAVHDEALVQPTLAEMQSNEGDSLSVATQVRGAVSEIAPPTIDAAPPLPISAVVEFSRSTLFGRTIRSTHHWRRAGNRYTLSIEGGSAGGVKWFEAPSLPLRSEGQFLGGELRPESFLDEEGGNTRFDWAAGEARSGDSRVFALQRDTKDPLSLAYQVMRLIRRGVTSVLVVDGQEARAYDLMLLAEETLELPAGQFPAWRVRVALQSNPQVFTDLWLGKEVCNIPLKIRESLGDESLRELVAERISVDTP